MEERKLPYAVFSRNFPTIILKILTKGPLHGYGISLEAQRVYRRSISSGSIYPMLHALENKGLIRGTEGDPIIIDGRPTRYYELTENGRTELANRIHHLETLLQSLKAEF
jgi:DNA-binding PadR family transcriptional regulator